MKKAILFAMGALIMAPSAAFAADDAAPQEAPKKDPGDKWVCKTDKMTGSLTRRKRICMKLSEWDRLANETGDSVNKYVNNSNRPDRIASDPQKGQGW